MKINPQYAAAYCNKLMAMQYLDVYGNEDSLATARAFGEAFVVEDGYDFRARDLSPERKLRIGYVSGDFNAHPVAFFTRDAITRHHREAFEIYCYYNCTRDDEWTAQFREAADCWRVVYGKTSAELIEMIRNDAPDILIDLAGHTDKTRVPVFGTRMAPIQAHWVGYTGTIGLSTMDYLILDPISAPPGADRHYAEALTRLPYGRFCYTPLAPDEPLAEPPCLRNGYVTFGCFNNITKVGAGVIAVWAQILKALPDARLILKSKSLIQPSAPAPLLEMFEAAGVSRDRIELRGASSYLDMLREYNDVDIALDPFPFGGATTTCDCLYMGLPVINLPGDRLASRQSVAFLQPMGHAELCADSLDDYVAKAVALAGDPERLIRLRPELRRALLDAPFSDGARFVTGLEKAFRIMWRRFVSGERASPIDIRAEP
jgi:predicted O-linked N-acetylglucosamine transferase (SPINDLY family)